MLSLKSSRDTENLFNIPPGDVDSCVFFPRAAKISIKRLYHRVGKYGYGGWIIDLWGVEQKFKADTLDEVIDLAVEWILQQEKEFSHAKS